MTIILILLYFRIGQYQYRVNSKYINRAKLFKIHLEDQVNNKDFLPHKPNIHSHHLNNNLQQGIINNQCLIILYNKMKRKLIDNKEMSNHTGLCNTFNSFNNQNKYHL